MLPCFVRSPGEDLSLLLVLGAPVAGPRLPGVPSAAPPDAVDRLSCCVPSLPQPLKFSHAVVPRSARLSMAIAIRDMIFSCFRCRSAITAQLITLNLEQEMHRFIPR
jgi:hypothetical protein